MDNCWRENKNRYVFAYLCFLIQQGIFKQIIVNFFTIGHTHSDPDQAFSRISVRLHTTNAITLNDFMEVVRDSINNSILLDHGYFDNIPNVSDMMNENDWLNSMTGLFIEFNIIRTQ